MAHGLRGRQPMSELDPAAAQPAHPPWTCPFCPLLCDTFGVDVGPPGTPLKLVGSDCPRASAALAEFNDFYTHTHAPEVIAAEIVEDLQAALDQFVAVATSLRDSDTSV